MKYSFSCPATCHSEITVDAKDDDEALAKSSRKVRFIARLSKKSPRRFLCEM